MNKLVHNQKEQTFRFRNAGGSKLWSVSENHMRSKLGSLGRRWESLAPDLDAGWS